MRRTRLIAWLSCCILGSTLLTTPPLLAVPSSSTPSAAQQLSTKLAPISSWQAHFTQRVLINGRTTSLQQGQLYIRRPGYLRWEIHTPFKQIIWFTPQRSISYDPELAQAIIQPLHANTPSSPLYLLSAHTDTLLQPTRLQVTKSGANRFVLRPQQAESWQEATLTYTADKLVRMEIATLDQQQIQITFSQIIINPRLDPQLFSFQPTAEIEILESK